MPKRGIENPVEPTKISKLQLIELQNTGINLLSKSILI